jgi:hypothetical protein
MVAGYGFALAAQYAALGCRRFEMFRAEIRLLEDVRRGRTAAGRGRGLRALAQSGSADIPN